MSSEALRGKILSVIKSKIDKVTGGSWKVHYAPNISEEIYDCALMEFDCYEPNDDILVIVDTTLSQACDEGMAFTTEALHYKNGHDEAEVFEYAEIENMRVIPHWYGDDLVIATGYERVIGSTLYKKTELQSLLYQICAIVNEEKSQEQNIKFHNIQNNGSSFIGADIAGTIYGDVSAASTAYSYDKFATPQGHGFAAERANHMYDTLRGHKTEIIGDNNKPSGPDRMRDGIFIQSKYYQTGSECIKACFDKSGDFRYVNDDGSLMQIEVPSDKYDDAVKAMESSIRDGQMRNKGVTDPAKAKDIVRKGHYTYQQAKNIAKAGNIDSLKFDAQNGIITGAFAGGISAGISFAVSIWNGEDFDVALENAGLSFLKVGGTAALTSLCVSQLSRTGFNSVLVGTTDAIVGALGPRASAVIVNAFKSGSNIYGAAAMKSASKLLRGNIITGLVVTGILSLADLGNIFMGRISFGQLFKNVTSTAASVVGGTAGWVGGASVGATVGSVIPVVGTAIGGFLGGLIGAFGGGSAAGGVTKAVLDEFIEDDAEEMLRIVQSKFEELAGDYLVNKEEAEEVADKLKDIIDASTLKDMYASSSRRGFADDMLRPIFDYVASKREKIYLPDNAALLSGIKNVLEGIAA